MVDAVRGRPAPPPESAPEPPQETPANVAGEAPAAGSLQRSAVAPQPAPAAPAQQAGTAARPPLARSARPSAPSPSPGAPARGTTQAPAGIARTPAAARGRATAGARRGLARAAAATASAPALARTPADALARPALTLLPTPPAPEPTPGPAAIARTGADELAAATGGQLDYGDDGMASIDFTGEGTPTIPAFSTTPVTVSREVDTTPPPAQAPAPARDANVLARAETTAETPSTAVTTQHSSSIPDNDDPAKPADPDEIYEQVMTRLRRDLIAELEQNGHLLRDTF
jgi:hypothetical protein